MDKLRQDELNMNIALFFYAYRTLHEEPDRIIEKFGIHRVHHRIMFFVARMPGLNVNSLLSVLEISKQALHQPLKTLIEKGFIYMEPSSQDRRMKLIYLTDKGKELEEELSETQREQMQAIFDKLGSGFEASWRAVMQEYANERKGTELKW